MGYASVEDIYTISPETFASWPNVGNKAIMLFEEFCDQVISGQVREKLQNPKYLFKEQEVADLGHIKFTNVQDLIEQRLYLKLARFDIKTVEDLARYTEETFGKLPGVGKTIIDLLRDFLQKIRLDPASYLAEHRRSEEGLILLKSVDDCTTDAELIQLALDAFLNHNYNYGDVRDGYIVDLYFGLSDGQPLILEEISDELDITRERVRQLFRDFMPRIAAFITGCLDEKTGARLALNVSSRLTTIKSELASYDIVDDRWIRSFFRSGPSVPNSQLLPNYLKLFLAASRFWLVPVTYHFHSSQRYYALNPSKEKVRSAFAAGKRMLDILNEHALSMTEAELFTRLLKDSPELDRKSFQNQLALYEEIERIDEGDGEVSYAIRLDKLKTVGKQAKRILNAQGAPAHIDVITSKLNEELETYNLNVGYSREQVRSRLGKEPGVESVGKMSTYLLTSWGRNTDSITNLIRKILKAKGRPLWREEIADEMHHSRPRLKVASIFAILSMDYPQLTNGKFALPEWKAFYEEDLKKKVDKPSQTQALIEILQPYAQGLPLRQARDRLVQMVGCSNGNAYHVLRRTPFEQFENENETYIKVRENFAEELSREQKFFAEVSEFLAKQPNQRSTLKHLQSNLQSSYYKPNSYRKKLNEGSSPFDVITDIDPNYISLRGYD